MVYLLPSSPETKGLSLFTLKPSVYSPPPLSDEFLQFFFSRLNNLTFLRLFLSPSKAEWSFFLNLIGLFHGNIPYLGWFSLSFPPLFKIWIVLGPKP